MRIIAGEFCGRKLLSPEGDTTRPITDRVKQSLFDIVSPYIEGAAVYDCFAGTGSMGLECLSRGAAHVTFFELDKSAGERLRRNIGRGRLRGRRFERVTDATLPVPEQGAAEHDPVVEPVAAERDQRGRLGR